MGKLIYSFLTLLLGSSFRRVLVGAGLGLASSVGIKALLDNYITSYISNLNSISSNILSILGLAGIDTAISVIIGALITRATIKSLSLSLTKLSN